MCSQPRSVRKRSTSSSGFTPGSIRRKSFSTSWSSSTIELFDCSTPIGRISDGSGSSSEPWKLIVACCSCSVPLVRISPTSWRISSGSTIAS